MLFTRYLVAIPLALLLLLAACTGGSGQSQPAGPAAPALDALPGLGELDGLTRQTQAADDPRYELLNFAPVLDSGEFVAYSQGQLSLTADTPGEVGWAVFAQGSFPTDSSVFPTALALDRSNLCWLAVADYALGRWRFYRPTLFSQGLGDGADLVSPAGNVFVAVIADGWPTEVSSLELVTNLDLPGGPTAVLTVLSNVTEEYEARFTAANSSGGEGTITTVTYDFGDGSDPVAVTDPEEIVTHTYDSPGPRDVSVTVESDQLRQDVLVVPIDVGPVFRELLVVYNSSIPESEDLADYYCSPDTGRAIDPDYVLGLEIGESVVQVVNRAEYESLIRNPIKAHLDASGYKETIKYILLMKGVPYQISGTDRASVDSELCLLYSDGSYPLAGWIWNDPVYQNFGGSGFYLEDEEGFQTNSYTVSDESGGTYPLNYLVGRLSAYTFETAKQLVDRSIIADTTGDGWIILDSRPGTYGQDSDTMVDPVWPYPGDVDSGYDLLSAGGKNAYQELTNDLVTRDYAQLPPGASKYVLAYCSWGVHSGHRNLYILLDLQFDYLPGACFMSYESFNGQQFSPPDPDDPAVGHPSQGQICDFFHMGGTVAIGNVWEPYTIGVGDERWVFDRYIHHGDRWIEAAYKGLRLLSWMEVVVGDPLCRVVAE